MSIADTTNELFSLAQQALGYASGSAGRINVSAKPTLKETPFSYTVGNLKLQEPPKFSDLFGGTDNAAVNIASVNGDVAAWLETYFPSINGSFKDVPEDYLVSVIGGVKPFGAEQTIFDSVWQQSQSRAERTVRSERATLSAGFSSRGFTLPAGALQAIDAQSEIRVVNAVLDVNREQAVKNADIRNQILQQAVQLSTQLKLGILNTAADLFRAYTTLYQLDSQSAQIKASAYQSFYSALSSYHSVEVNMEQLKLRAAETKAGVDGGIDKNRISNYAANSTGKAHAKAANAFASIANGAAGAAGTLEAHITTGKPA
ncbi:MAG: hypothetical protein ACRER8_22280 [Pseudomonas sp.]|uniref:hypothetical protein n=1 Tax=Pseudomonas sp. TaxID=306 RepID=UPI003D6FC01B